MNTTNRTVGTIEEALMLAQPHELLAAFVPSFNDLTGQLDELSQEREGERRLPRGGPQG